MAEAARALANAVVRGLDDPHQPSLHVIVEERNAVLQRAFPGHKFEAEHFVEEWGKFAAFARKGGFRIDLTD